MLARAWRRLNDSTIGTERYFSIALQNADLHLDLAPLVARHARGLLVDLGAGRLAWRGPLSRHAAAYLSADATPTHPELDLVCDATRPLPFRDGSLDTVFCCSVLEHAREPWLAFAAIHRALRPGGTLLVSVPFLFYRHGDPQDYWRFTGFGLDRLARQAGFEVVELAPSGSLAHLLLNPLSLAASALLAALRLGFLVPPLTRLLTASARALAPLVDRERRFAQGHVAVLRRPAYTDARPSDPDHGPRA
jgi:SAM-dependent methyltransferase